MQLYAVAFRQLLMVNVFEMLAPTSSVRISLLNASLVQASRTFAICSNGGYHAVQEGLRVLKEPS